MLSYAKIFGIFVDLKNNLKTKKMKKSEHIAMYRFVGYILLFGGIPGLVQGYISGFLLVLSGLLIIFFSLWLSSKLRKKENKIW